MKISACWIVRNEAQNLPRSIESVVDCVDEFIVVDTGSEDDTAALAASLGASVYPFEWIDDFSAARNYAIEKAGGDIIFAMEADFRYEPKPGKAERKRILQLFENPQVSVLDVRLINFDTDRDLVTSESAYPGIFRNDGKHYFVGAIHERISFQGENIVSPVPVEGLQIIHSGYSASLLDKKAERNLALLKKAAEREVVQTGSPAPLTDFYLMREYNLRDETDAAFESFQRLHENPQAVRALLPFRTVPGVYFAVGLTLSVRKRSCVSRRDLLENHVKQMQALLPDYDGSLMIPLNHQAYFDLKESAFLQEFDRIMADYDPASPNGDTESALMAVYLYEIAADAAWRRCRYEKAFDYSSRRFRLSDQYSHDSMSILLSCIRGQKDADIVLFLNSLFESRNNVNSHMVLEGLQREGFQQIFSYYVKKQAEEEILSRKHYLLFLILTENFQEAVAQAMTLKTSSDPAMIEMIIFLAIFCSRDPRLYEARAAEAGGNRLFLDAAFTEQQISDYFQEDEISYPLMLYRQIAFLAGRARAGEFAALFAEQRYQFLIRAGYLAENGFYADILKEEYRLQLHPLDLPCQSLIAQAYLATGEPFMALSTLTPLAESYALNFQILNQLQILAESEDPAVSGQARPVYEKFAFLYDEFLDNLDVVNTKKVFDDYTRSERKGLGRMTPDEFAGLVNEDPWRTAHPPFLMMMEKAAEVYEEAGVYTMAQQCYRRMVACSYKPREAMESLGRVFRKLGNSRLAEALPMKAKEFPPYAVKEAIAGSEQEKTVLH